MVADLRSVILSEGPTKRDEGSVLVQRPEVPVQGQSRTVAVIPLRRLRCRRAPSTAVLLVRQDMEPT